jgi:hypothetical protein
VTSTSPFEDKRNRNRTDPTPQPHHSLRRGRPEDATLLAETHLWGRQTVGEETSVPQGPPPVPVLFVTRSGEKATQKPHGRRNLLVKNGPQTLRSGNSAQFDIFHGGRSRHLAVSGIPELGSVNVEHRNDTEECPEGQ